MFWQFSFLQSNLFYKILQRSFHLDLNDPRLCRESFNLRRTIGLEMQRTFEQDPKYPIRLLVDVAIKALSPAINDPTTAVQAIDQIEDLLKRLGRRELQAG